MTLAERLDSYLEAVRAGTAPPEFIIGVRNQREFDEGNRLLRGRKGRDAIILEITDDPRYAYHEEVA